MTTSKLLKRGGRETLNENEIRELIAFLVRRAGIDKDITRDDDALVKALVGLAGGVKPQQVVKHCITQGLIACTEQQIFLLVHEWDAGKVAADTNSLEWLAGQNTGGTTEIPSRNHASPRDVELPESYGKYKIVRELGSGGMGQVYLAIHPITKGHVAIKTIHQHLIDPRSLERFEREGAILISVSHRYIVRVYEVHLDHDPPYIVMEYIEGKNLDEALPAMREKGIPGTVRAFRCICEGVQAFHEYGIVHHDLKPGNIRITERGDVSVVDLGLAVNTSDSSFVKHRELLDNLSESFDGIDSETIRGTPSFMAPEQIDGRAKITPRADVYALGKILFFLLTGMHAHDTTGSKYRIMQDVVFETGVPDSVAKQLPLAIQSKEYCDYLLPIVSKCLESEPGKRYENAGAIVRDLDIFMDFVRNRDRILRRKQEARQRKLVAGLVTAAALCAVSVAMSMLFLSQRNAEARAAREAGARIRAQEKAAAAEKKTREADRQKNLFSWIENQALADMKKARWEKAEQKLQELVRLDPKSISVRQDLAKVLSNQRNAESVEAFLWLAEHGEPKEREENILMAMIAQVNYGREKPALKLGKIEDMASRLKSEPYVAMGKVLVLGAKGYSINSRGEYEYEDAQLARDQVKEIVLKKVDDLYESAASNYILGLNISQIFPDRALRPLSEACAKNRDFTEAMIAQQRVMRSIARSLSVKKTAKSVHLVAALNILNTLRIILPGDPEVDMAYADCLLDCAFLPIRSDFKHSYLKKAGEVVSSYQDKDWNDDRAFMKEIYAPNAVSIEITIAKAYARRYQVARQRHLMDTGMFFSAGWAALNRLFELEKKGQVVLSKQDKIEILRIKIWLTGKKTD